MQVKFFFFQSLLFKWRIAGIFYQKTIWTDVNFLDGSVLKTVSEQNFVFSHISIALAMTVILIQEKILKKTKYIKHKKLNITQTGAS